MRASVVVLQLILFCAQGSGASIVSSDRKANIFTFQLSDGGAAELEWVTASTFRVSRFWSGRRSLREAISRDPVNITETDLGAALQFSSKYLVVEVDKAAVRFRIRGRQQDLLADAAEVRKEGMALVIERQAVKGEKFYGLGPRTAAGVDLRGNRIVAAKPFLISSRGYGEYFTVPAAYTYDLAATREDRREIRAEGAPYLEYFFYYGPTPKEILEEHARIAGTIQQLDSADFQVLKRADLPRGAFVMSAREGSWTSLCESVRSLVHASLSGILLPAFDIAPYRVGGAALLDRALQLGSVTPIVYGAETFPSDTGLTELSVMRSRLSAYLLSYGQEARDRGLPFIRALAMQFPADEKAAAEGDAFMLGDELLVAPACSPQGRESLYLPMGTWTDFRTGRIYRGKQTVRVENGEGELPVFVKSGSIVPLDPITPGAPLELHYFPNLGAEFFVFEEDVGDYSQFHAGPAGDLVRSEIEPVKERTYEWIAHNVERCRGVVSKEIEWPEAKSLGQLKPGFWFYDPEKRELHTRARAAAGDDVIVKVYWR